MEEGGRHPQATHAFDPVEVLPMTLMRTLQYFPLAIVVCLGAGVVSSTRCRGAERSPGTPVETLRAALKAEPMELLRKDPALAKRLESVKPEERGALLAQA